MTSWCRWFPGNRHSRRHRWSPIQISIRSTWTFIPARSRTGDSLTLEPQSTTEPGLSKSCQTRSSISTSRLIRCLHSRLFNCHRLKFQSCRIRLSLLRRGRRRIRLQIQVLVFVLVAVFRCLVFYSIDTCWVSFKFSYRKILRCEPIGSQPHLEITSCCHLLECHLDFATLPLGGLGGS